MRDPLASIRTRATPASEPADPRQVPNSGGGHAFQVDPADRLRRFLVLGVAGGTYYASNDAAANALALENAQVVLDASASDHVALVDLIVDVSEAGRAPRPQPALFALAVACANGTADERAYAFGALPRVARTATHLNTFLNYVQGFRGWGRQLRRGVGAWYLGMPLERLAYQVVKYRQREGWTHRDVLRKAHPNPLPDLVRDQLFGWITGRWQVVGAGDQHGWAPPELRIVEGYERVKRATSGRVAAELVREYALPWEALPDEVINRPEVWEALLDVGLPVTALLRHLPRLTRLGLLPALGGRTTFVTDQLTSPSRLRAGRVHPLQLLVAQRTYASGRAERGRSRWEPSRPVVDALDAAFYASFGTVVPTNRRFMLALDVSDSMTWHMCAGLPVTPREASAALAMANARVEPNHLVTAFSGDDVGSWTRSDIQELSISPRQRLDDLTGAVGRLSARATDCSLPMRYALDRGLDVDVFVIFTDNETNRGVEHPHQALRRYREARVPDARLVVCAMTSTGFSIAQPDDPLSLDVVGCDTSTPQLIGDFARGEL